MTRLTEQWKTVPGFSRYEVSNLGLVRSSDRILRAQPSSGYPKVRIKSDGGEYKYKRVHELVLSAFRGTRPDGLEVCHWDGDPSNNRLENLRYDTPSENQRDRVRHGRHPNAVKTHCVRGHLFTKENTYIRKNGGRNCKQCAISAAKRNYTSHPLVKKTHCKRGHPRMPENLYSSGNGRQCKLCSRLKSEKRKNGVTELAKNRP